MRVFPSSGIVSKGTSAYLPAITPEILSHFVYYESVFAAIITYGFMSFLIFHGKEVRSDIHNELSIVRKAITC